MSETPDTPETPPAETPEPQTPEAQTSRIGVDSWVAESEARRSRTPAALLGRGVEKTPDTLKLLVFVGFAASVPFLARSGDLYIFGTLTLFYAALGLGLNVVVGFAGLLDLGYVAFAGLGAYNVCLAGVAQVGTSLARRGDDSDRDGGRRARRAPSWFLVPATVRRLLRDRHALLRPGLFLFHEHDEPAQLTGGPNSLPNDDPITFRGYKLTSDDQQYYLLLGIVTLLAVATYFANRSRTGRAWRAQRDDPLAAQAMSIPVNRVKILAAVMGAAIAGLCGAIDGSRRGSGRRGLDRLQRAVLDPHLRDRHPRRRREHRGSLPWSRDHQLHAPVPRTAERPPRHQALALLRHDHPPCPADQALCGGRRSFSFPPSLSASRCTRSSWPPQALTWTSGVPESGDAWIAHWAIIPGADLSRD